MIQLPTLNEIVPEAAPSVDGSTFVYAYPAPKIGDKVLAHDPNDPYRHARHAEVVAFHHQPGVFYQRWAVTVQVRGSETTILVPDYLVFPAPKPQLPLNQGFAIPAPGSCSLNNVLVAVA